MKKMLLILGLTLVLLLFVAGCSSEAKQSDSQYDYVQQGYGGGCGVSGQEPTKDSTDFTYALGDISINSVL